MWIRLPDERWQHILTSHPEMANYRLLALDVLTNPERILEGGAGELMSIREVESRKWLVVVYRELSEDGFVITAFLTRRHRSLEKRAVIWSH
jgi:hypothetical protein